MNERTELATRIEQSLWIDLLEAWFPRCIDPNGGFHQSFDREWNLGSDRTRSLVFQSRAIWSCATVAEAYPEQQTRFTEYALHGTQLLLTRLRDPATGAYFWNDQALDQPYRTYGLAFALFALSAVVRLTGDQPARRAAEQLFEWIDHRVRDAGLGGYIEATDHRGRYHDDPATKSHNTTLHVFEALLEYERIDNGAIVKQRIQSLVDLLLGPYYREEGNSAERLDRSLNPVGNTCSFGHDLEVVHLLIEADRRGYSVEPQKVQALVDFAMRHGWDFAHGGVFAVADRNGTPVDRSKLWWVQAESLLGWAAFAGHCTGKPELWDRVAQQWQFIETKQIDRLHGGWYGTLSAEGIVADQGVKGHSWKSLYHETRALLGTARWLRSHE